MLLAIRACISKPCIHVGCHCACRTLDGTGAGTASGPSGHSPPPPCVTWAVVPMGIRDCTPIFHAPRPPSQAAGAQCSYTMQTRTLPLRLPPTLHHPHTVHERSHGYHLGQKPDILSAIKFSQESDYDGSKETLAPPEVAVPAACHAEEHSEYHGDVVVWGEHHQLVREGEKRGRGGEGGERV